VFHEITKPAIVAAVANPGKIDMNLVSAQQARQVLDMIVGFRISPVLWKHLGTSNSLSAGRCQTPALRLVYENELEARKTMVNGAVKHRVQASFGGCLDTLVFELDKTFSSYTDVEGFLEASKTHKHMLEIGKSRVSVRSPPKPFNTATMLQSASNLFGMGAKDAMSCCQTLYQLGHITYMRTESRKYSPVFTEIAAKYIADTWTKEHVNADLQTITENSTPKGPIESDTLCPLAHEAIRVTNIHMRDFAIISSSSNNMASVRGTVGSFGPLEKVYKMIWQNTVQSCMSCATFNCLPLSVSSANSDASYKHTIETVKFAGFLDAKDKVKSKDPTDSASIVLQHNASKGAPIPYKYIETIVGFNAHHSRFTEASLIDKLDELGIGRPSTFSMLVDVIQTRKYVSRTDVPGVKIDCREYRLEASVPNIVCKSVIKMMGAEHKKLVIDPIGTTVIEFLLQHFAEFFSYDYTNAMEKRLDLVAAGNELWHRVCADCDREICKLIRSLDYLEKRTYKIGDDHVLFFHKNSMLLKTTKNVDGKYQFRSIKRGLKVDMAKLEKGEYTFADLAEIDTIVLGFHDVDSTTEQSMNVDSTTNDDSTTTEQSMNVDSTTNLHSTNVPVLLKPGKYGYYLEVDSKRISVDKELKALGKTPETVTLADLAHLLNTYVETDAAETEPNIRVLTPEISVRKSKYGPYVFYQPECVGDKPKKKPKFYDLKKFDGDCWKVDREVLLKWLNIKQSK
jgi:DNA topoisomerase-1